ncbi:Monooxygenase FAD-binding [Penicillium argentinense]|uniref:Monooxygenase FAD-binding n=1 Tax=Penicillium argentinense TaxID=1131581 RepID=A0A9W9G068_9EURO|nr:Monooxygenase FAD-binding [Penicillium argentinense]KAJ5109675.1 Monooxygenase FAD-binding [Penicillium argentinense]
MWCATSYVDLLIVGAGPAGLAAASWAARYNMSTQIIDQKSGRKNSGHADGLQSRTLEILESFGIVDPILKLGVPEVDMCYWVMNPETGKIERNGRDAAETGRMSRFGQILLNQGSVEQNFIDHLRAKSNIRVEWNRRAVSLDLTASGDDQETFPVAVGVACLDEHGNPQPVEASQMIHARYLIACDGAHSWVRHKLNVSADGPDKDTDWGVLDIVPITNFPDIRQACSVQSGPYGSIMMVPRENKLTRFYIRLQHGLREDNSSYSKDPPRALVEMAKKAMWPYDLAYKRCDWCSYYTTSRRVVQDFRPHKRIFLAGDAAHTHSLKGGQGMNVSIQDTYNLVWKLGAVLTEGAHPDILETYDSERRCVATKLMDLDANLVRAFEDQNSGKSGGAHEVRDRYAGFMAGVDVTYSPSVLVADGVVNGNSALAHKVKLGMRLASERVTYHCDGTSVHLAQRLPSDGSWKLLVFPADLEKPDGMKALKVFADYFSDNSHLAHRSKDAEAIGPLIDVLLIHSGPRNTDRLLDLPRIFHPFDEVMGWDYWKVFADVDGQAYSGYGIDGSGGGCLILCRPDQHVAWVGALDDVVGLDNFFSFFS